MCVCVCVCVCMWVYGCMKHLSCFATLFWRLLGNYQIHKSFQDFLSFSTFIFYVLFLIINAVLESIFCMTNKLTLRTHTISCGFRENFNWVSILKQHVLLLFNAKNKREKNFLSYTVKSWYQAENEKSLMMGEKHVNN